MTNNADYQQIKEDLHALGIKQGDDVLVHSSFKSLGPVSGGIDTLIQAFLSCIGDCGTLLIPALSYKTVTAENPVFDIRNTPSCVGAVSEFFRKYPHVERSMHPTHSVCVLGFRQDAYINGSEADTEPVGENSPFCKLPKNGGKILMLGCGIGPNTSMHGVEEKANAPYALSRDKRIYTCIDKTGRKYLQAYYYHYISQNGFGQRYKRLQNLIEIPAGKVLQADCYLIDSATMWEKGVKKIQEDPYYFVEKL